MRSVSARRKGEVMITRLQIGPIPYTVAEVVKLIGLDADGANTYLNGRVKYQECRIEIEAELPPDKKVAAVIHEALHAILEQAGIAGESEPTIIALGYGLLALLRDNPELVQLIQRVKQP